MDAAQACLVFGYAVSAALLLIYFLWEGGPFHISRRVETCYLTAVLLLVYTISSIWGHVGDLGPIEQVGFQFRQLMRLLVLMMILQHSVLPRVHARFADSMMGARKTVIPQEIPSTIQARRLALELDATIGETLAKSGIRGADIAGEKMWGPALFVLLMFEEVIVSAHALSKLLLDFLIVVEVIAVFVWLISEARRFMKLGGLYRQIHAIVGSLVRSRDKECLNFVLANVSMGSLLEVARRDTVQQITDLALEMGLLNLISKAVLVHALHQKGIRFSKRSQQAVCRIVFSCKGEELTTLKNLIDGSGGYLNLYKMVYEGITSPSLQKLILKHFETQAKSIRTELGRARGIKLLSDVDDTLYASGGKFPAGCDTRFPRHVVYPGCLGLYRALDQESSVNASSCNLVFLSARPHVYKDLTEDHSYRRFRALVAESRMHSLPTLLPGRLRNGFWAMLTTACLRTRAWRSVGEAKYRTFKKFRALYLEYDFVFCGDDGQGDLLCAQLLAKEEQPPAPLRASLIHQVLPGGPSEVLAIDPRSQRGETWSEALAEKRIFFHRTYVGAAVALHSACSDLMTAEQLAVVANDAVNDFEDARLQHYDFGSRWAGVEAELSSDLSAADDVVRAAGLPGIRAIETQRSPVASVVALPPRYERSATDIKIHVKNAVRRQESCQAEDLEACPSPSDAEAARERRKRMGSRGVCFLDRALSDLRKSMEMEELENEDSGSSLAGDVQAEGSNDEVSAQGSFRVSLSGGSAEENELAEVANEISPSMAPPRRASGWRIRTSPRRGFEGGLGGKE